MCVCVCVFFFFFLLSLFVTLYIFLHLTVMHSSTFGKGCVGMSACPLVVLACESLHVCTVCIWRCEHARFCVEVFYALYINFHSFTHNVSEQRDKGCIHVIRVHDTTHLAVTTRQGNRRSRTTPHKERMRGLVKHRDYPAHSYIVNERYNSRNKRASQEKTKTKKQTVNGKNR